MPISQVKVVRGRIGKSLVSMLTRAPIIPPRKGSNLNSAGQPMAQVAAIRNPLARGN